MVDQRSPAYVDKHLFHECLSEVFISSLADLRHSEPFSGQVAICLMDSTSPHVSERSLRFLGENGVLAVAFPAHTTNLFQGLDFVLFDALKKLKATAEGEFGDDSVCDQISRLVQAYQQTATSGTAGGSFRKAEIVPDTSVRPFKLAFEEERIRGNEGFREIGDRDVRIEELSRKRQAHGFGIVFTHLIGNDQNFYSFTKQSNISHFNVTFHMSIQSFPFQYNLPHFNVTFHISIQSFPF
jgi:hypothetical protein